MHGNTMLRIQLKEEINFVSKVLFYHK